jgi:hypothetical protein
VYPPSRKPCFHGKFETFSKCLEGILALRNRRPLDVGQTGHVGVVIYRDGKAFVAESLNDGKGQQLTPWESFYRRTYDGSRGSLGEVHTWTPTDMTPQQVVNLRTWAVANAHGDGQPGEQWDFTHKCTEFVQRAYREGAGYTLPVTDTPITTPNDYMQYLTGRSFDAIGPQAFDYASEAIEEVSREIEQAVYASSWFAAKGDRESSRQRLLIPSTPMSFTF